MTDKQYNLAKVIIVITYIIIFSLAYIFLLKKNSEILSYIIVNILAIAQFLLIIRFSVWLAKKIIK